jgi:hypothetical protein
MAKSFKDLKGEGTAKLDWICLWCQKPKELNSRGFCSPECENEFDKSIGEWFKWFTSE